MSETKNPETTLKPGQQRGEDPTPYGTEYAKSGRAGCRKCNNKIGLGELRMSVRFVSPNIGHYSVQWFHFNCFWTDRRSQNVKGTEMILGFDDVKPEDQEKIRERIAIAHGGGTSVEETTQVEKLKIEVAKTSTGKCQGCKAKINDGELRLQTKAHFYHPKCLAADKKLAEGKIGQYFDGFKQLSDAQKQEVDSLFPKTKEKAKTLIDEGKKEKTDRKNKRKDGGTTSKPADESPQKKSKEAGQHDKDEKEKASEEAHESDASVPEKTKPETGKKRGKKTAAKKVEDHEKKAGETDASAPEKSKPSKKPGKKTTKNGPEQEVERENEQLNVEKEQTMNEYKLART